MQRHHAYVYVLVLLMMMTAVSPNLAAAQKSTILATPSTEPQRPTQPTEGPGSSEAIFGGMTTIKQSPPDRFFADFWLFVPADPVSGGELSGEPFPVVIFIPGSGAYDASAYLAWIEHVVQRGAVVIFPLIGNSGYTESDYGQAIREDVRNGLAALEIAGIPIDVERVAVVGHSLGGVLAIDYAASAAVYGLPIPSVVMSVAPGCSTADVACLNADLSMIPATTRVLVVTESDDFDPTMPRTIEKIWSEMVGVAPENRDIVQIVTDSHGLPALLATHWQAIADHNLNPPDALDWYGTWKWLDALMGCAFDGEWCSSALGNTPEQRYMGTWSDGVAVTEAVVTHDPD